MLSCNFNENSPQNIAALGHPKKQEVILEGSPVLVDNGILVLVQNGPLKTIPSILIAGNDSVKQVMKARYDQRMANVYQPSAKSWVKISGNFLREDTIRPVFQYNWIEFLDKTEELKEIQELEE